MKSTVDNEFEDLPLILKNLLGKVYCNGVYYSSLREWYSTNPKGENIVILNPISVRTYKIKVKDLAKKDSPFFRFNEIYNNNCPIPLNEMQGKLIDETDKMKKFDLWSEDHNVHWIGWIMKSWILEEILV